MNLPNKYNKLTNEDLYKIIEDTLANIDATNTIKIYTGIEGAINVATSILKELGVVSPSREEALQYANKNFEHNGQGSYII
jgi:hypothetical protein